MKDCGIEEKMAQNSFKINTKHRFNRVFLGTSVSFNLRRDEKSKFTPTMLYKSEGSSLIVFIM